MIKHASDWLLAAGLTASLCGYARWLTYRESRALGRDRRAGRQAPPAAPSPRIEHHMLLGRRM